MNLDANLFPPKNSLIARHHFFHLYILITLVPLISGCAQTGALKSESTVAGRVNPSVVLLVEPDVQLSLLTAGGLQEPHAEWTETGKKNVINALDTFLKEKGASLIAYRYPQSDPDRAHRHNQILKMHTAVGVSILNHKYNQALALPTKVDRFDWTLGPETQLLKNEFGADYALFVYLRDSYSTAGRTAVIVVGALLGVAVQGGLQVGFASLVNLDTGEVVWFNRLIDQAGDLRTMEPATRAVTTLLTDAPF